MGSGREYDGLDSGQGDCFGVGNGICDGWVVVEKVIV